MNAPVAAPKEFSRLNEVAHRNYIEGELADTYRKSAHLIVPSGFYLGFNGATGKQAIFQLDADDVFSVSIDGATVLSFASSSDLSSLSASLTAAYQAADVALGAGLTVSYQAADDALEASLQAFVGVETGDLYSTVTSEYTSAINTVDGKLSASYALTVDGNGRIASMKLLSDGTTSSVKFLSTTFQVYNGSTDEAPFEVVGGVVKIKTANVGVLVAANIDTGAVTASKISVSSLDAVSATVGLLRTASSGARMELESNVIRAYDSSGTLRARFGVWT